MITPHENKTTEPIVQKRRMNKWVKRSLWVLFGLLMMVLLSIGGVAYYYYPCSLVFHETWTDDERKELSSIYDQMKLPLVNQSVKLYRILKPNAKEQLEYIPSKTYYSWEAITRYPDVYKQADEVRRNFADMVKSGRIELDHGDEIGSLLFMATSMGNHRLVESLMKSGADPFKAYSGSNNAIITAVQINPFWTSRKTVDDIMLSVKALVPPGDKHVNKYLYLPMCMAAGQPDDMISRSDKTKLLDFMMENYLIVGSPVGGGWGCLKPVNPMYFYLQYGDIDLLNKMVKKGWDINETYDSESPIAKLFYKKADSEQLFRWALDHGLDVKAPIQTLTDELDENHQKVIIKKREPLLYAFIKTSVDLFSRIKIDYDTFSIIDNNFGEYMDSLGGVVDLLIQHGADINATDAESKTILDVFEGMESFDEEDLKIKQQVIDFLKKRGAKQGQNVDSLKA